MFQSDLSASSKKYSSLEEALDAIRGLKDDPLANAGTNIAISTGNTNAKTSIVGEAPNP